MATATKKPKTALPDFKNARFVIAKVLKKPYVSEDEETGEIKQDIVYVTQGGQAHVTPCTRAAYKRVNGKRFRNKAHSGLWRSVGQEYLVAIEKTGAKRVIAVDAFPAALYGNSTNGAPTFRRNQEHVKIRIDQSNGDITVEELPPKSVPTKAAMAELLKAIHLQGVIEPGDTIKSYEVLSKEGDRYTLEPVDGREDPGVET